MVEKIFSWVPFRYEESILSLETISPKAFADFFILKEVHAVLFAVLRILIFGRA